MFYIKKDLLRRVSAFKFQIEQLIILQNCDEVITNLRSKTTSARENILTKYVHLYKKINRQFNLIIETKQKKKDLVYGYTNTMNSIVQSEVNHKLPKLTGINRCFNGVQKITQVFCGS